MWYTFIVYNFADRETKLIHLKIKKGEFQNVVHDEILSKLRQTIRFTFKGKIKEISWMNEK